MNEPTYRKISAPVWPMWIALGLSVVALVLSIVPSLSRPSVATTQTSQSSSTIDRIKRDHIIHAGYTGFKPYTIVNTAAQDSQQRITGFCVDMVNEIAKRQSPPWKVEWSQVTFETLKADIESGRCDFVADAVYQTAPRAAEFSFTSPFSYFGVAVGMVRKGDTRFKKFEDLDRSDITIALAQGWTSSEYAQAHLTKPKFHMIAVGDDAFVQLQEVIAGRADVALQDVPTILQFARAHSNEVDTLWIDMPPTRVGGAFMARQGDIELIRFLDTAIDVLRTDGTLDYLDKKWRSLGDFKSTQFISGAGLSN